MRRVALVLLLMLMPVVAAGQTPRVYLEPGETVDAGNAAEKAKRIDFSAAISAALVKKKVPVTTVMEPDKAQWIIKAVSSQKKAHHRHESR
jgi:hypothetical protein